MRTTVFAATLICTAACGRSEAKFQVETIQNFCQLNEDCTKIVAAASCVDAIRLVDWSHCDYDPRAAKACHQELESEATCVDNGDVGTSSLAYPMSCDQVYVGCGPLFEEPYGPVVTE